MSTTVQNQLKSLGVTPWQFMLFLAAAGFWVGEIKPKLDAASTSTAQVSESMRDLVSTVHTLTTKVEVHAVLLTSVAEIRSELREVRKELSTLQLQPKPKTASN